MILLVAQETASLFPLQKSFRDAGYEILCVTELKSCLRSIARHHVTFIIIASDLADVSRFALCRLLGERDIAPLVLLTPNDNAIDREFALGLGATESFSFSTSPIRLLACMTRVSQREKTPIKKIPDKQIKIHDGAMLSTRRKEVQVGSRRVTLSSEQFRLLAYLSLHSGKVVTRQELREYMWGKESTQPYHTLTGLVTELRGLFEDDPHTPRCLLTVRGKGYKLMKTLSSPEGKQP